jgi:ribose 5-phosphate isomerase RpiB
MVTQTHRLAVASEPEIDDYRQTVIDFVGAELESAIFDVNAGSEWETNERLVEICIDLVITDSVDFVVLASRSGNALQMIANKHKEIRAAPIPNDALLEDALDVDANMCEVCSTYQTPQAASDMIIRFARQRERLKK